MEPGGLASGPGVRAGARAGKEADNRRGVEKASEADAGREADAGQEADAEETTGVEPRGATARHDRKGVLVRLAITASGAELSSKVDQRFGRARYLLVVETPERTVLAVDNQAGMNAAQGAGIQAAQSVIDNGAKVLITGHIGPKAFRALKAAGIEVYLTPEGTVDEAISQFEAGSLELTPAADVNSHW